MNGIGLPLIFAVPPSTTKSPHVKRNILVILMVILIVGIIGAATYKPAPEKSFIEQLIVENYTWVMPSNVITVTFRNVGNIPIDFGLANIYVNESIVPKPYAGCNVILTGETCTLNFVAPTFNWITGTRYPLKVSTGDGSVFMYGIIAGGSSANGSS